jgi:4-hydroxy-tetrahydrodipicolinate synthase
MVRRYRDGDPEGARRLNDEMRPAFDLLKVQTNPIAIKAALNLLGHEVGGFRLPMVEPTEQELEQVRGCLERAGILSAASA